jgi:hypothetical protein
VVSRADATVAENGVIATTTAAPRIAFFVLCFVIALTPRSDSRSCLTVVGSL